VFGAASPGQRLQLRFDRGGVSVGSGARHLHPGLHAIGYGAALSAADEVAPRAKGNHVVYARGPQRVVRTRLRHSSLALDAGQLVLRRIPQTRAQIFRSCRRNGVSRSIVRTRATVATPAPDV
jgi:hypothetical protein